jgi:hypothetical protein
MSVLLGAAIGFAPSLYLAHFQAAQQQEQLRFERRLTAIQGFSTALSGTGQLFAKNAELSVLASIIVTAPKPEEEIPKLRRLLTEQELLESEYVANLHAQSLIMTSVFGVRFKVLSYEQLGPFSSDLDLEHKSREALRTELRQTASKLVDSVSEHQQNLIEFIDNYESELNSIADIMNN